MKNLLLPNMKIQELISHVVELFVLDIGCAEYLLKPGSLDWLYGKR